MRSPFPGMNPFFEQPGIWQDFHTKFLTAINEALVVQIRPKYVAMIENHIYVHEMDTESRVLLGRADLGVVLRDQPAAPGGSTAVLEAPARVELAAQDVERVPYLEIRDRQGRQLVTVIELLSPSNKRGEDRRQYIAKRSQLLASPVHVVEIDLLRGGRPMPSEHRPNCVYSVLVSRSTNRPQADFWPLELNARLPVIPVPLHAPDPDARVDLQGLLDHVYEVFSYGDFLYDRPPDPPLTQNEHAWSLSLLDRANDP